MFQGARVWIPHSTEVWENAEIVDSYDGKSLSVLTDTGEVILYQRNLLVYEYWNLAIVCCLRITF